MQDAVWTVESHTADSGTSPWQAFGSPRNYARTFQQGTDACSWSGDTRLYLVACLIGSLAGGLLIVSVRWRNQEAIFGFLPPAAGIVLASVALVLWVVFVVLRLIRRPKRNPANFYGRNVR